MTRTIRAPRIPEGTEVGDMLSFGAELVRILSIQYEDRCVVLEVEPIPPAQPDPEPAQ